MTSTTRPNRITYINMEPFGRQLSDDEIGDALQFLNLSVESEPTDSHTVLGDLFSLYAQPFVIITNRQNGCKILDSTTNQWQEKNKSDLRFLLRNFLTSIFWRYTNDFCIMYNEADNESLKMVSFHMIKKLTTLIKEIGKNGFIDHIVRQARYHLREQSPSRQRKSRVYFIFQIHNPSVCKIGHSSNINRRLSKLQSGNPHHLYVRRIIDLPEHEGSIVESFLHQRYTDRQVLNEWYRVSTTDVDQIDCRELSSAIIRGSQPISTL